MKNFIPIILLFFLIITVCVAAVFIYKNEPAAIAEEEITEVKLTDEEKSRLVEDIEKHYGITFVAWEYDYLQDISSTLGERIFVLQALAIDENGDGIALHLLFTIEEDDVDTEPIYTYFTTN